MRCESRSAQVVKDRSEAQHYESDKSDSSFRWSEERSLCAQDRERESEEGERINEKLL